MTDAEIARINELAKKSKGIYGLTEEEKAEQQALRHKFIDQVKGNLKSQLDNMHIQEADGSITHVKDLPKQRKSSEEGGIR